MNRLVVPILVSCSFLAYAQTKSPSPEIRGAVTDQNGAPIPNATVYAVAQSGLNDAFPISVKSDPNGHFDFHRKLNLGSYKLYARGTDDESANPLDSFYADLKVNAPIVDLTRAHPSATVPLKLAPPVAVLTGRVIDADTGANLSGYLSFMDGEGHGHSIHVDGDYRILLPPNKDVTLMVMLPGPPDRSVVPVAPLRLEPGQYVNLDLPVRR